MTDRIELMTGDITTVDVDAIVNAANSSLLGGGGVDGAIHRAAGPQLLMECKRLRRTSLPKGLPTGEAVLTGGARLPAARVIHTVGPVWHGGDQDEDRLLANAYRNSLRVAAQEQLTTVAFPAVSTGVYGFPAERAAVIAHTTIAEFLRDHEFPKKVLMVFFSDGDRTVFQEAVAASESE